ncbi:hypothetical protein KQ305_00150 [Synechococcus sp. CS-1332]|nr:hypothetical protein [Synechococcus sp. CS-1332]
MTLLEVGGVAQGVQVLRFECSSQGPKRVEPQPPDRLIVLTAFHQLAQFFALQCSDDGVGLASCGVETAPQGP